MSCKFIDISADKFGPKKVRDFMEIQLIQENDLLIRFLDIFDAKYASEEQYQSNNHIRVAKDNMNEMGSILGEPLLTERTGKDSGRGPSSMLRDMREKRKESKQISGQETLTDEPNLKNTLEQEKQKYDEIMSRLDKYKSEKEHNTDRDAGVPIQGLNND